MPSTRWIDHLNKTDADVDGRQQPVYVTVDFDGNVGIDLSADVADGAMLTSVDAHLWQLPAVLETDYVAVDELLVGGPVTNANMVSQRVTGLARDRVYRLAFGFGPGGNRRGASVLIAVGE